MKKVILFATALICSVVLSACGGGSNVTSVDTSTGVTTNPGTPPKSIEGKMIIDNGRGTTNNQDTERVK